MVVNLLKNKKIDKLFFYFDPPYLISDAPYNSSWNEKDEKKLLGLLSHLIKEKVPFALNNFLSKGNEKNLLLDEFIKINQNEVSVSVMSSTYKNSNYHRKENKTIEVFIEYKGE